MDKRKIPFLIFIFGLALCLFFWASPLHHPQQQSPADLATIENFKLLDHLGKSHELYYYSDMKAVVLIWQGNACPIFRLSLPYLHELQEKYPDVTFLMINANPQDNRFSIADEAREFNIQIPILEDSAQIITESLGVDRTATVMLINSKDWSIVYQGALHDQLGYETQKPEIKNHYLRDALNALLSEKEVPLASTPVKGCLINLEYQHHPTEITYTKDVAPIFKEKCLSCHSREGIGPWAMTDYETLKGWGMMIREVIRTKRMPPWGADPYIGKFRDDRSLSPEETGKIVHWIEAGMPRGEGEDPFATYQSAPLPKWPRGEPDIILQLPEQQIPATGQLDYRYVRPAFKAEEDLWLRAAHIRPKNKKALHHSFVFAEETPGELEEGTENAFNNWLTVYGPGRNVIPYPGGTSKLIPKGSSIVVQLHYTPTGKPEIDTPELGLYFSEGKPEYKFVTTSASNFNIQIPPEKKEHKMYAEYFFDHDALLFDFIPHMHYRGRYMQYYLRYSDGREELVFSIPDYDFNWQTIYRLTEPKFIPSGTTLICKGAYDNSSQNRDNPNPKEYVYFGPDSMDEMYLGFFSYSNMEAPILGRKNEGQDKTDNYKIPIPG